MIPSIGVMVGGYICLRCIEIYARVSDLPKKSDRIIIKIVAAIVLIETTLLCFSLFYLGSGGVKLP